MRSRWVGIVALCSLASAGWSGQGLDTKVEGAFNAQPVGRLVAELAKVTGVDLRATTSVARDIVVVRAHGASLKDLLARIAHVTGRKWTEKDGRYTLTTSPEADREIERENLRRRAAKIRAGLTKMTEGSDFRREWSRESPTRTS